MMGTKKGLYCKRYKENLSGNIFDIKSKVVEHAFKQF